jgi:hypothetical protein
LECGAIDLAAFDPVMANGEVTAAIFGVVGVLSGVLVTASVDVWLQSRREKAERETEERLVAATARLLHAELEEVQGFLSMLTEQERWAVPPIARWVALWDGERKTLAAVMGPNQLDAVARAFLSARVLEWNAMQRGEGTEFEAEDAAMIDQWQEHLSRALDALEERRA